MKTDKTNKAIKTVSPFKTSVRRPITWNFVNREVPKVIKPEDRRELPLAA